MKEIAPPACLIASLLLFIAGFASLAVERPQVSIELHRARVEGDEQYRDLLEQRLEQRRRQRIIKICSLFALAVVMAAIGFVIMRPSR